MGFKLQRKKGDSKTVWDFSALVEDSQITKKKKNEARKGNDFFLLRFNSMHTYCFFHRCWLDTPLEGNFSLIDHRSQK